MPTPISTSSRATHRHRHNTAVSRRHFRHAENEYFRRLSPAHAAPSLSAGRYFAPLIKAKHGRLSSFSPTRRLAFEIRREKAHFQLLFSAATAEAYFRPARHDISHWAAYFVTARREYRRRVHTFEADYMADDSNSRFSFDAGMAAAEANAYILEYAADWMADAAMARDFEVRHVTIY